MVAYTVAAVILGVAIATLPFGTLLDHMPIKPIIPGGGTAVVVAGIFCASNDDLWILITARFVQGLFIPVLTTCLAAYLARALPPESLIVVMGSYVSATVAGRLSQRYGSGPTLVSGLVVPAISIAITVLASLATIVIGLVGICAGFFTAHAAAVGLLSEKKGLFRIG